MNKKTLIVIMAGVIVAGFIGMGCPKPGAPSTPIIVSAPESTWVNATTPIRVFATAPNNKDIRYITDLGQPDNKMDTSDVTGSGDTNYIYPKWTQTGTFNFKVAAYLEEDPTKISEFSEPKSIRVLPNSPPENMVLIAPEQTAKDALTKFRITALDPENDSIQFYFDFGDGSKGWIDTLKASGETLSTTHKYNSVGTFYIKYKAKDKKGSECAPDSHQIEVISEGKVIWRFSGVIGDDSAPPIASPVVVDTVIYTYCDNGYLYGVGLNKGREVDNAHTKDPDEYAFNGHPAYCATTGHIIIGADDGYLYAFYRDLTTAWKTDSMSSGWGTPAINGTKIYIASDDDTLFYLEDAGNRCAVLYRYKLPAELIGAPVIDQAGNVIFSCGDGILYKMEPNQPNIVWACTLGTAATTPPVIDDNGNIYVADDSGYVHKISENRETHIKALVGLTEIVGLAVGTKLYVTTDIGKLFAFNLTTLQPEWILEVPDRSALMGAPLLAANGLIYFMDDDDKLYCAQQSDGRLLWTADCLLQVGGRGLHSRRSWLGTAENPSLTIGPNGTIIVVGDWYMYGVSGYADGTLQTSAPWPKWQKDLYNTGKK